MFLMNTATGSVDTLENWQSEFAELTAETWGGSSFESAALVEVVKNDPSSSDYNPDFGEWRPVCRVLVE